MGEKIGSEEITCPIRCIVYAVAELAGLTNVEVAEYIGISPRMVYNNREYNAKKIDDLKNLLRPLIRVNKREIREVEKSKIMAEVERRLGVSFATWDEAMNAGGELGYVAGKEVRDRIMGKPANTTNIQGRIAHDVEMTVVLPEAVRMALGASVMRDVGLLESADRLADLERPALMSDDLPVIDVEAG